MYRMPGSPLNGIYGVVFWNDETCGLVVLCGAPTGE